MGNNCTNCFTLSYSDKLRASTIEDNKNPQTTFQGSESQGSKLVKIPYQKLTYEDAFPDTASGGEDLATIFGSSSIDPDTLIQFHLHLKSFKLSGFLQSNLPDKEMYLSCEFTDDLMLWTDSKLRARYEVNQKGNNKDGTKKDIKKKTGRNEKALESKIDVQKLGSKKDDSTKINGPLDDQQISGGSRWESNRFLINADGSFEELNAKHSLQVECECQEIRNKFLIFEIHMPSQGSVPQAVIEVEFVAIALGPKKLDLEIKNLKTQKAMGRLQLELDIKQYQTMNIQLHDLQCQLIGQEERAVYYQFKVITNNDVPKVSLPTTTQIGLFKKDKNATKYEWDYHQKPDAEGPGIQYDIAMENLKNSSVQMLLKVDGKFSVHQTDLVIQKLKKEVYQSQRNNTVVKPKGSKSPLGTPTMSIGETRTFLHIREDNSLHSQQKYAYQSLKGDSIRANEVAEDNTNNSISRKLAEKYKDAHKNAQTPDNSQKVQKASSMRRSDRLGVAAKEFANSIFNSVKKGTGTTNNTKSSNTNGTLSVQRMQNTSINNEDDFQYDADKKLSRNSKFQEEIKKQSNIEDQQSVFFEKISQIADQHARTFIREPEESFYTVDIIIAECYVNFTKLLQSEMRKLDKRDSSILQSRMSSSTNKHMSIRKDTRDNILNTQDFSISLREKKQKGGKFQVQIERKGFDEQLWHMGKVVGRIKGLFKLSNLPVVSQMQLGVLTERGVMINAAPILIDPTGTQFFGTLKKGQRNEQITQLIEYTKRLRKIDSIKDKKAQYKTYNEKEKIVNEMIEILADGDQAMAALGNPRMYQYSNELDLIRAQEAMIDLGFHCLTFVDTIRYEFKRDYYEIISQIFNRDELKLTNVSLSHEFIEERRSTFAKKRPLEESSDQEERKTLDQETVLNTNTLAQKSNKKPFIESQLTQDQQLQEERLKSEKLKIAQCYQKLLYMILDDCLVKFCRKDVEPFMKAYMEICISIAFFRVPFFQKLFMQCVAKQPSVDKDGQPVVINEWRNMAWDLDEETDSNNSRGKNFDGLMKLFDWQVQFYNHLPQNEQSLDNMRFQKKIEINLKWQNRVTKRSLAYFQIVKRWGDFIQQTVQINQLFWQDIPGYRYIVKSILYELKTRPLNEFPDPFIEATLTLIQNSELLSSFVTIIFQRTNAYDSVQLANTLNIVTKWFNHLERLNQPFPSNFDFSFFTKGIQVALEIEHSVTIPRTLHLLYRTLHYLPIDQRTTLMHELFQKQTLYRLFFNWSYNIRDLFIALFIYQVEYLYIVKTSFQLNQTLQQVANQNTVQLTKIKTNDSDDDNIGQKGLEKVTRIAVIERRANALKNLKKVITKYEEYMGQNPDEAEEGFDRSVSMKRQRYASSSEIMSIRQSQQRASSAAGRLRNSQDPQIDKKLPTSPPSVAPVERKRISPQGLVLRSFLKSYQYFETFMQDLDILSEYMQQKKLEQLQKQNQGGNVNSLIVEKDGSLLENANKKAQQYQVSEINLNNDLEKRYQKVLTKIPSNLKIYIPSAIEDYHKQLEEYEKWKFQCMKSGAFNQIYTPNPMMPDFSPLNVLPEFNMEKNMPVEDDDNLDKKKDEW